MSEILAREKRIDKRDLSGLLSFSEEYPNLKHLYCVANIDAPFVMENVTCLPWEYFLSKTLLKVLKE